MAFIQLTTQRPVAIVVIDDFVVSATMEQYGGSLDSASDLYRYSDERPPIIYSDFPATQEGIDEVQRIKIEERCWSMRRSAFISRVRNSQPRCKSARVQALEMLEQKGLEQIFTDWLQQNGKSEDEVLIERFTGRYGNVWLVFDLDGVYVDYL